MIDDATNKPVTELSAAMLRRGASDDPDPPIELRAGPLTMLLEGDSLRYIRLANREIVRRIYCAVRDRNWGTAPNHIERSHLRSDAESFEVEFDVRSVDGDIDFRWLARIVGTADGVVEFSMEGEAYSEFWRSRIGFCVLHPIEGCAGQPCTVFGPDGSPRVNAFPRFIAADNPFLEITAIHQQLSEGVTAELTFNGDLFEMEDQRNWTDASFKTFCTPLRIPRPVRVCPGDHVSQRVTLRLLGNPNAVVPAEANGNGHHPPQKSSSKKTPIQLSLLSRAVPLLPRLGLAWTAHETPWTEREAARLRNLRLSHLSMELHLADDGCDALLRQAVADASRVGTPLEIAIFVTQNHRSELTRLRDLLRREKPRVVRFQLFHEDRWSTPWSLIRPTRQMLAAFDPRIPLGGGSRANFLELNRNRPPDGVVDFVAWPIHPQEHAFDDASLIETAAAQAETVRSARQFADGRPLVVGPVTFKRRANPYADSATDRPSDGGLPEQVDCRQLSLFGAAWTLGSLKHLAESGVEALTYFETLGWLGVTERDEGPRLPDLFPSLSGAAFPLYFVLADAAEMRDAVVLQVQSSDPLAVEALGLRMNGRMRLMIANPTDSPRVVSLNCPAGRAMLRTLDESNAIDAMRNPEPFRKSFRELAAAGSLELNLTPYSYTCLDFV